MSITYNHRELPRVGVNVESITHSLTALVSASCRCVREWRQRARSRRELLMLSEYDLRDVPWTRADAVMEASKPFWQA